MDWKAFLKKKNSVAIMAFALVILGGFVYKFFAIKRYDGFVSVGGAESSISEAVLEETAAVSEQLSVTFEESNEGADNHVYVYVCGAVNCPGVYEVSPGALLYDAINLAGGLTGDASAEHINLVMTLNENMSIYIPTREEVMSGSYSSEVIMSDSDVGVGSPTASDSGLININLASRADLMSVPGIGEVTADSIINYRENNGGFSSVDDLMKVEGIGKGKYEKFKDYLCV